MTYQAVVFDLDGTLTDSSEGVFNSVLNALEQQGHQRPDAETLRRFIGPPMVHSYMTFCGMSQEKAVETTALFRARYNSIGWRENRVYPGMRKLLKALKDKGVYLAVATGKPQAPTEQILDYFHIAHYFDKVVGSDENETHADKATIIARALDGRKAAIMVGDTGYDVEGARANGLPAVAVGFGFGTREELESFKPYFFAETVQDLYGVLGIEEPDDVPAFVSLEGNDGCGKSTQMTLLADRMTRAGYPLMATREPGGTAISEKIRALVLDPANQDMLPLTESYLYAAARAQHVEEKIKPALAAGQLVISDRFVDSSLAYQGGGRELGIERVARINAEAIDGLYPDVSIYFDIDYQEGIRRRGQATGFDRIEMLDNRFHERVENAWRDIVRTHPARYLVVDGRLSIEKLAPVVFDTLVKRLDEMGLA